MALRLARIKPKSGVSHLLHIGLTALLPALVYILVRINVVPLALMVILLSKWRMLAVKPRHWPANIRANAVDLLVGTSILVFMAHSGTNLWQIIWAVTYGIWLLSIKPGSSMLMVSLQALLAQTAGFMALFLRWGDIPIAGLVLASWVIAYASARHFFSVFDEPMTPFLSYVWGYFAAALVWVLSHWLLFYGVLAQPTLLLSVIGFGLSTLYYLEKTDRLSILIRRQLVFVMVAIIIIVITFSDWGDKAI
jgi:hypothetical protein